MVSMETSQQLTLTHKKPSHPYHSIFLSAKLMHVYEQGCIFFVIEVFSWWRLHTCINIDKVGTVTVSPGLFFRLRFLLFSLYIFFFHIFLRWTGHCIL